MESIATSNLNKNDEDLDNIIIFEISGNDNTYKQITVEKFLEKLKSYEYSHKKKSNIITYGSLNINFENSEVYRNNTKIDLSDREYKLLRLFIDNKGKILSSEQILNCVWSVAYANPGMLRVAIKRFRSKIDPDNQYLKTIRNKGYILVDI